MNYIGLCYRVFSKLKRKNKDGETIFECKEKVFNDSDILKARMEAFDYAENLLEVLFDVRAITINNLEALPNPKNNSFLWIGEEEIEIALDFQDNEGGEFAMSNLFKTIPKISDIIDAGWWPNDPSVGWLVHSISKENQIDKIYWRHYLEKEILLHLNLINEDALKPVAFFGLTVENCFKLTETNYDWIIYDDNSTLHELAQTAEYFEETILENRFLDWPSYSEPREREESEQEEKIIWSGFFYESSDGVLPEPTKNQNKSENLLSQYSDAIHKIDLVEIKSSIKSGESLKIEFKPALVYNFKTKEGSIGVKGKNAQAICAFMNTHGGQLIIGVNDQNEIIGLMDDISLTPPGKRPEDFLRLQFDHLMRHFFSKDLFRFVNFEILTIDQKNIIVITVWPVPRPVFLNGQFQKEFYIRTAASSVLLNDPEDLVKHCLDTYQNPQRRI